MQTKNCPTQNEHRGSGALAPTARRAQSKAEIQAEQLIMVRAWMAGCKTIPALDERVVLEIGKLRGDKELEGVQAQCWICPQCYDDTCHTPGDAHCLLSQVSGLAAVRKELEGHVLALREALKPFADQAEYVPEEAENLRIGYEFVDAQIEEAAGFEGADIARASEAIENTAQAGREAEASVLERLAEQWSDHAGITQVTFDLMREANRLRNGGSDNG